MRNLRRIMLSRFDGNTCFRPTLIRLKEDDCLRLSYKFRSAQCMRTCSCSSLNEKLAQSLMRLAMALKQIMSSSKLSPWLLDWPVLALASVVALEQVCSRMNSLLAICPLKAGSEGSVNFKRPIRHRSVAIVSFTYLPSKYSTNMGRWGSSMGAFDAVIRFDFSMWFINQVWQYL